MSKMTEFRTGDDWKKIRLIGLLNPNPYDEYWKTGWFDRFNWKTIREKPACKSISVSGNPGVVRFTSGPDDCDVLVRFSGDCITVEVTPSTEGATETDGGEEE